MHSDGVAQANDPVSWNLVLFFIWHNGEELASLGSRYLHTSHFWLYSYERRKC